jgi:hydrogenase/urease accessory protein HupE
MGAIVYILCALTSIWCSVLLLKAYKQTALRLLFWSGLAFVGLALNNILLFVDFVVFPSMEMTITRTLPALLGSLVLVYGLIKESV